jgi:hypothetical protein
MMNEYMSFGGAWWAILPKFALTVGPVTVANSAIYSLLIGSLKGKDPRQSLQQVRATFKPGLIRGLRFWPPIDLATFTVIPLELQVLWYGVAKIAWICILSRLNNERLGSPGEEKKASEGVVGATGAALSFASHAATGSEPKGGSELLNGTIGLPMKLHGSSRESVPR